MSNRWSVGLVLLVMGMGAGCGSSTSGGADGAPADAIVGAHVPDGGGGGLAPDALASADAPAIAPDLGPAPPAGPPLTDVAALSLSGISSCALLKTGGVDGWGGGFGGAPNSNVAVALPSLMTAKTFSVGGVGGQFICGVMADATVSCLGSNSLGQLGARMPFMSASLVPVAGLSGVKKIVTGANHGCALLNTGTVACWGNGDRAQHGDGVIGSGPNVTAVINVAGASDIGAGEDHACVVVGDNVTCWGQIIGGLRMPTPTVIGSLPGVTALVGGRNHACALINDGTVRCWGQNANGQLGNGTTTDSMTPVTVTGLTDAIAVGAGAANTCAVRKDGTAACWGTGGLLLNPALILQPNPTPVAIPGVAGAVQIAVGGGHACVVTQTGTVLCWGANNVGQLGGGSAKADPEHPLPVQVVQGP